MKKVFEILTRSHRVLKEYKSNPIINIDYLEGVAGIRFAIMEVASLLHLDYDTDTARNLQRLKFDIMHLAEKVCTDPVINTTDFVASTDDAVGPALYLLKLLVRQYGFPYLKQVFEQHRWVIPESLQTTDQVISIWASIENENNFFLDREKS